MDVHGLAVNVLPSATNIASQTPDSAPAAGTGRVLLVPFTGTVSLILCLYWCNLIQLIAIVNQQHIEALAIKELLCCSKCNPSKNVLCWYLPVFQDSICVALAQRGLQTFDVLCKRPQSRHSFALLLFWGRRVCSMCAQYQAVPDTVAASNRHSQSKVNENLTNSCLQTVLLGEAIFLEFPHIVSSAVWFRTRQALLKKAEGSALDVF